MKHSLTGGSNAHIWWYCPGSVYLCKVVENKVGKAAERGTVMHEAAAALFGYGEYPMLCPSERAIVQAYVETIRAKVGMGYPKPVTNGTELRIERLVTAPHMEQAYGTIDSLWLDADGRYNICDLKTGKTLVEVKNNEQLLTYAYWWTVTKPILHIFQPTVSSELQTWSPSDTEWEAAKKTIDWALDCVYGGGTPPLIKGAHCSKCRASAFCPKYKESALSAEW